MESSSFKTGLKNSVCPEVINPLYDIIMWSKIDLVMRAILKISSKLLIFVG